MLMQAHTSVLINLSESDWENDGFEYIISHVYSDIAMKLPKKALIYESKLE